MAQSDPFLLGSISELLKEWDEVLLWTFLAFYSSVDIDHKKRSKEQSTILM